MKTLHSFLGALFIACCSFGVGCAANVDPTSGVAEEHQVSTDPSVSSSEPVDESEQALTGGFCTKGSVSCLSQCTRACDAHDDPYYCAIDCKCCCTGTPGKTCYY